MKPRLLTGALALAMVAGAVDAQGRLEPDASVAALVRAFCDARDHFDAKALGGLLTPDYVEVSPRGEIDRRPAVLGFYAANKATPVPAMTRDTQDVRVLGDAAIVIGSVSYAVPTPTGGTVERTVRVTYVERRVGGRWLMASTQYTGVQPPRPAP